MIIKGMENFPENVSQSNLARNRKIHSKESKKKKKKKKMILELKSFGCAFLLWRSLLGSSFGCEIRVREFLPELVRLT